MVNRPVTPSPVRRRATVALLLLALAVSMELGPPSPGGPLDARRDRSRVDGTLARNHPAITTVTPRAGGLRSRRCGVRGDGHSSFSSWSAPVRRRARAVARRRCFPTAGSGPTPANCARWSRGSGAC